MNTQNILKKKRKSYSPVKTDDLPVTKALMSTIESIIELGTQINPYESGGTVYETLSYEESSINDTDIGRIEDVIFPPVITAIEHEQYIDISLLLTAKTEKPLIASEKLEFYYQFVISTSGLPQLNIYISYLQEDSSIEKKYWNNSFRVVITDEIVEKINLKQVILAQVFLFDIDPRTSRGTVTTVKRPM